MASNGLRSSASTTPMLGTFIHNSEVACSHHDPIISLASLCVRTSFGPSVQLVADCLQCRGVLTLRQIYFYLLQHKKRKCMTTISITKTQIRASLLVLMQHSIVTMKRQPPSPKSTFLQTLYIYHQDQALHIIRYSKYVEYMKKAADATAACLVEELLLNGRLRTVDVVVKASEQAPKSDKYTTRQTVIDAFCKLVSTGFIEQVSPTKDAVPEQPQNLDEGEFEFDSKSEAPKKKGKRDVPEEDLYKDEDPAVVLLLKSQHHYRAALPVNAVWRVNFALFHESFRAYSLGKLVSERHGHKVQSAGSLVTAALRYRAHTKHGARTKVDAAAMSADMTVFSTDDIVKYLPKPILQLLEKKPGGMAVNLSKSWQELSDRRNPEVARRIGEDRYEVSLSSLNNYLRERIVYQIVNDRQGEVAARVMSILGSKGWLEAETLAEHAMVPVKDTREALHQLYRSGYIDLFHLSNSRQYNPTKAIYLWCQDRKRLMQKITENVATALWQISLRREHEVEVGKQWIERAQQAADTDENDHESDKLNYQKFCLGLERLDVVTQQLDETLMALRNF